MKLTGPALVVATFAAVAGCTTPAPVPQTAPGDMAGAAVVRRPAPEPAVPATPAEHAPAATAPIAVPADAQYVCVAEANGERTQTAITFSPKVAQLCRRHPEMGPCQYERNLCRQSGGRVYVQGGVEITKDTEAQYDRRVLRVRFKSN